MVFAEPQSSPSIVRYFRERHSFPFRAAILERLGIRFLLTLASAM